MPKLKHMHNEAKLQIVNLSCMGILGDMCMVIDNHQQEEN